jgi:hypothetical protein
MAFKEVASLDADVTVALGKKDKNTGKAYPKQAEGYYLGSRTVPGKRGPSTLHFLQTPAGNLGVWGTTDMNRKLSGITAGNMVRITSTGVKATPKGDMYTYKVEEDNTNSIEVSALNEPSNAIASDEDDASDEAASNDDGGDDEQDVAVAAAARKAKVDAILNGRKTGSKTK